MDPLSQLRASLADHYAIEREIGAGDMATAYLARDGRFLGLVTNRNDYQLVVGPNWLPELEKRMAGGR